MTKFAQDKRTVSKERGRRALNASNDLLRPAAYYVSSKGTRTFYFYMPPWLRFIIHYTYLVLHNF
jgi:hypothetical protein